MGTTSRTITGTVTFEMTAKGIVALIHNNSTLPRTNAHGVNTMNSTLTVNDLSYDDLEKLTPNDDGLAAITSWSAHFETYSGDDLLTEDYAHFTYPGLLPDEDDVETYVSWFDGAHLVSHDDDDEEMRDGVEYVVTRWFSSSYSGSELEDDFTRNSISVSHRLTLELGDVVLVPMHEVDGREHECTCAECLPGHTRSVAKEAKWVASRVFGAKEDATRELHGQWFSTVGSSIYVSDLAPSVIGGSLIATYRHEYGWMVVYSQSGTMWTGSEYAARREVEMRDGVTLGDLSDAIAKEMDRIGVPRVAEDEEGILFGRNIRLYKVTGPNGEAINGGNFTYDLPPDSSTPGQWTPTISRSALNMCARGYHVTIDPFEWISSKDCRVFEVEAQGMLSQPAGDKIVASSVRLVREVDPFTLTREGEIARYAMNEHVLPALRSLANLMSQPGDVRDTTAIGETVSYTEFVNTRIAHDLDTALPLARPLTTAEYRVRNAILKDAEYTDLMGKVSESQYPTWIVSQFVEQALRLSLTGSRALGDAERALERLAHGYVPVGRANTFSPMMFVDLLAS